jgi:L-phenylalanine/L-methionine N-acetyltransferase
MSIAGHPVVVRRAEPGDAEAIHATFLGARAIAGTLQLPYPSVEMWRRRLAEGVTNDYLLVATIAGEVVGNMGLRAASKSPRRRHVGDIGMAVRDDRQRRGVGTALMHAAMALYRKFGFAIEGTCRAYAYRNGSYVDAYLMARLSPSFTATLPS